MSTTAKTTASKSTSSKVGAVSTKPAAKRAPRKAAAPKAPAAPKAEADVTDGLAPAKPAAKAPAKAKAPKKPVASFTTDEHPDTFTCAGACGETKSVKSFPTVDGPAKRATTCRSCRDAARKAKAA